MKRLSFLFGGLTLLLSHIMCAVVAYEYCALLWGGRFAGYSAPAGTAFLLAIPYAVAMAVCTALALIFWKRAGK